MGLKIFNPEREDTAAAGPPAWHPGDLLFFWGRDWKSRAIEIGTIGPSHVGGIFICDGAPLLCESTTLCDLPCWLNRKPIRGVQAQIPADRINRYRGKIYRVPLVPECALDCAESALLTTMILRYWLGKPYDLAGALLSGSRILKWSRWLPYPDLGSAFCSFLWSRLLMRLNRLNWDDPTRYSPARLYRTLRRTGVYGVPHEVFAHAA